MVQSRPHPLKKATPPSSDEDSDPDERPLFSWRQDPDEHLDNYYSEPPDPATSNLLPPMDGYDSYGEPLEPNPAHLSDTESASGADETVEENREESPSEVLEYDNYREPLEFNNAELSVTNSSNDNEVEEKDSEESTEESGDEPEYDSYGEPIESGEPPDLTAPPDRCRMINTLLTYYKV
jgi:hypothetical protein